MLHGKDIKNIGELKNGFTPLWLEPGFILSSLKCFLFSALCKCLSPLKQRGYSFESIFSCLICLPFLGLQTVHSITGSAMSDHIEAQKDVFYGLKERYPSANKHYNITIVPDGEKVNGIDLKWSKKTPTPRSRKGVYFIQTNLDESQETTLWTIYNTPTKIEATFRLLKTDLSLRPVFHQKDENTEARLFLGLLASQLESFTRYQWKMHNINHDWRNIVRIMNTQRMVTSSMKTKDDKLIRIKKSSLPKVKVREIYDALDFKYQPFTMKKSVVPET